jgi:putative transcriptional regulator
MRITTEERRLSSMLSKNIQSIRKSKGLSQEELAIKLNVVRQTVSKWERGLSVPDSEMLITISEILETPVSALLGETYTETPVDDLKVISEKLEIINLQLARSKAAKRKILHWLFIILCMLIVITAAVLISQNSPYLSWDFNDPETAVVGTFFHAFEWFFFRLAPVALIGTVVGIVLTREKR